MTLGDHSAGSGPVLDVLRDTDRVRQTLGGLPQEFGVHPKATAEELLTHFAVLKGIAHRDERRAT